MDKILFFQEIERQLQSLKDFILEAKKDLGEISEAALMKLSSEDNLIYTSLWMLVNAHACEENKPAYFKWLEDHKFSLRNIKWTETDQKRYNTVLDGLKYAHEDLFNNKSLDTAKDIALAFAWMQEFKEKMYALARKEVEYDVSACGRRGRMGCVPQEYSEKAEEYQKKLKAPYDSDDIITAYEQGMMAMEPEVEKAYKNRDEVVFKEGVADGMKRARMGLPTWKIAERDIWEPTTEFLIKYDNDGGDGETFYSVIPTNFVPEGKWYLEINTKEMLNLPEYNGDN